MTWAAFRSSDVRYTSRPSANRRAARWAWDFFAREGVVSLLWLHDGYWCCEREPNEFEDVEADFVRDQAYRGVQLP